MTLTLTPEFRAALDHLESGHHLFLTGKAGTGKSTLIRRFLEITDRTVVTVAPTGIAALNVDGYTIHRLFSFSTGVSEQAVRGPDYYPGRFAKTLASLDTLVIDEVSMVRADLFDALVAALERFGPQPGEPFGGVQLVLVGDLYQLPPVVTDAEAPYIDQKFGTPYFFSAHAYDREQFPVVELTTVFRQLGDDRLVHLLNAVRDGALLDDARAELNARTRTDFEPPVDEFWLTLATTNRIVTARNRTLLERLPDAPQVFAATLSGSTDGFEHPVEDTLRLAVGAQVMLLNNDPAGRWVNGTIGKVTGIGTDGDGPWIDVEIRGGAHVRVRRHTWDITRPVVTAGSLTHEVIGTFTQLPLKLAWAITIHKSQGQTLDNVVVDLTGGTFANGQLYVALSRCTSLDGLVLRRDVLPRDLKADPRVRRFLTTGTRTDAALGYAYISALTVGHAGDRYRPRPVEIAVVTEDGDAATTVVNPTSDLYTAQSDYGITARDVQLAPVLTQAWAALSPLLAGRIPVGRRIDELLGWIDFELKRHDRVEPMPLGIDLDAAPDPPAATTALASRRSLDRARALADLHRSLLETSHGRGLEWENGRPFPATPRGRGYLLARSTGESGQASPTGFVVGGNLSAEDDAAQVLAECLGVAWGRVVDLDEPLVTRVREVERHFGISVIPSGFELAPALGIEDVLLPGARICFTGTVESELYGTVDRDRMETLAASRGLVPVASVTKTRTDVLVVAQRGSQSGKAKKAAEWGKPVIAAEDFLGWVGRP